MKWNPACVSVHNFFTSDLIVIFLWSSAIHEGKSDAQNLIRVANFAMTLSKNWSSLTAFPLLWMIYEPVETILALLNL